MPLRSEYYEVLGVAVNANIAEIRRAFRRGALKYHPDRYPHDKVHAERKFKELLAAYRCLSNPAERRLYDRQRNRWRGENRGLSPQELWEISFASRQGGDQATAADPAFRTVAAGERESLKANASLVLALVAMYCYPFVLPAILLGVLAVILSALAKRDFARGRGSPYSHDMAAAGTVIGAMATVLACACLCVWFSLDVLP